MDFVMFLWDLSSFAFILCLAWLGLQPVFRVLFLFSDFHSHFTLFSTIILSPIAYLPTHSPIPHSLTFVQPTCSPHDIPLLILSCIFHSHVHAILTATFSLSTPCHAPICFPKKTTTHVLCSITAHACATT